MELRQDFVREECVIIGQLTVSEIVAAMTEELVPERTDRMDEATKTACKALDKFIQEHSIDEFSVDVDKLGDVFVEFQLDDNTNFCVTI